MNKQRLQQQQKVHSRKKFYIQINKSNGKRICFDNNFFSLAECLFMKQIIVSFFN